MFFGSGTFVCHTQFTVPSHTDWNSVVVSGDWASDNDTLDLLIDSRGIGNSNPNAQFRRLTPFTVSGATLFNHGPNTLDFRARNFSGPSGLLVTT